VSGARPRLEIQVDEVVVRGLSPSQARSVVETLEARLQVLGESWAAGSSGPIAPRDEAFRRASAVAATAEPAALGDSSAAAVWTTVTGGPPR
jgi:hypothetical protein